MSLKNTNRVYTEFIVYIERSSLRPFLVEQQTDDDDDSDDDENNEQGNSDADHQHLI